MSNQIPTPSPEKMASLIFSEFFTLLQPDLIHLSDDLKIRRCVLKVAIRAVKMTISANPHSNPLNTDVYSTMKWWNEILEELEKINNY